MSILAMDQEWPRVLRSRLQDERLANDVGARLSKILSNTTETDQLGQQVLADLEHYSREHAALLDEQVAQLHLIADVFTATRGSVVFAKILLREPAKLDRLPDVIFCHYGQASEAPDDKPSRSLRRRLFETEPTAVIAGLTKSAAISFQPPEVHALVVQTLETALDRNVSLSKTSISGVAGTLLSAPTTSHARNAYLVVCAIQRLHAVVADPLDVGHLINRGVSSAREIAAMDRSDFVRVMAAPSGTDSFGIQESAAIMIWQQARFVDMRNERAWADFIQSREAIPVLAFDQAHESDSGPESSINLETLFKENDSIDVDEYSSALSPAAYLVDLLQLLRFSGVKLINDADGTITSNLLKTFFERRSDIARVELSKANTLTLVNYADLVNETLESYIATAIAQPPAKLAVFNEASTGFNLVAPLSPSRNVNWKVYQDVIQHQIHPMNYFPFNLGNEAMREYFRALDTSTHDLYRLFPPNAPSNDSFVLSEARGQKSQKALFAASLERRLAAVSLNLSASDFVIITSEAFQSHSLLSELKGHRSVFSNDEYRSQIGACSIGNYWGYSTLEEASADDQMAGKIAGVQGLEAVKDQLLPRSGLTFADLRSVLNTEYIGKQFVIDVENAHGAFSGKLEDMRLRCPDVAQEIFQPYLSIDSCARLLSFVKLWKRTGWSINDLDDSIVTLASARLSNSPLQYQYDIDSEMILDLAALQEISSTTNLEVQRLLPLWGTMRLDGNHPLYKQLFCQARLLRKYPKLANPESGEGGPSIFDHLAPLRSVLQIHDDLNNILGEAKTDVSEAWSLENVSAIYRQALLCEILDISAQHLAQWKSMHSNSINILDSPRLTLQALKQWRKLKDGGWTSEALIRLASPIIEDKVIDIDPKAASISAELLTLTSILKQKYSPFTAPSSSADNGGDDQEAFSSSALTEICSSIYDAATIESIQALVEGTWSNATPCAVHVVIDPNSSIARKVILKADVLKLSGVLDESEYSTLIAYATQDSQWTAAVRALQNRASAPYRALTLTLGASQISEASFLLQPNVSSDAVQGEKEKYSRRKRFMMLFAPEILARVTNSSIADRLKISMPSLSSGTFDVLFKLLKISGVSLADHIRLIFDANAAKPIGKKEALEGYLVASSTDAVKLVGSQIGVCDIIVTSNRHEITKTPTPQLELVLGQIYAMHLSSSDDLRSIKVVASSGVETALEADRFLLKSTVAKVVAVLERFTNAATLISKTKLSKDELAYYTSTGLDITNPSLKDIECLSSHEIAKSTFGRGSKMSLLDFYRWSETLVVNSTSTKEIAEKVSQTTGLPQEQVETVMEVCPSDIYDVTNIDAQKLLILHELVLFTRKIPVPVKTLASWAALRLPGDVAVEYEAAQMLESLLSSRSSSALMKANETLAAKRNIALVQFLMARSKIGEKKIVDVDSLFEHFLIDVQMGPQQQTSRVKQAISTVQLFIQRCLSGLEKKNGITTTAVKRSTWNWMSKFTLWQANRKVFLYPENWVDETLRDDKSQAFRAIEAVVLQSNLNLERVNTIVRQYIYKVNEIADLQVHAYFWEPGAGFQGKYHKFARTRTAPYKYYYRVLDVTGIASTGALYSWYPWSSLEVEIPAHEVDWDGKILDRGGTYLVPQLYRGRLFLFIPSIMAKTRPQQKLPDKTFKDLVEEKANSAVTEQYWEIKMGWVEQRNGSWSKKEISVSSVTVEGYRIPLDDKTGIPTSAAKMPSIASFQFRVSSRLNSDIVVIDVYRWIERSTRDYVQLHVGRFELRGTQMVVSDFRDVKSDWKHTVPTEFSKLSLNTQTTTDSGLKAELSPFAQYNPGLTVPKDEQALIALAPQTTELKKVPNRSLIWTLSYDEAQRSGPSALVVERTTTSAVDSYFGIPIRTNDGLFSADVHEVASVQKLSHDVAQPLMEVATRSEDLKSIYDVLENVNIILAQDAFGGTGKTIAKELATPYSIYNWELGFHLILLLMERLLATQQFEMALEVASLVFDPTADDKRAAEDKPAPSSSETEVQDKPLSNLDRCWKFPPFKNSELRLAGSTKSVVEKLDPGHQTSVDLDDWLANPFNAHSIARGRPAIYMKRFIIKYIEILVASGDAYFREDTLESIPLALQRYVQASQLFGKRPELIAPPTKAVVKTYDDISAALNDFGNAVVDMELQAPFFVIPSERASSGSYDGVLGMVRSSYFGIPANPQLVALRDLIDDRFHKIRNSLDINGNLRRLALFEPPLDPGQLVHSSAAGGMSAALGQANDGPVPNYRFVHLLQRAFQMCSELRSLSESYLAIKEKRDGEALAALRARQDVSMQNLSLRVKELQREDAIKTMEALETTRKSQVMRLKYYLALTGESEDKVPNSGKQWVEIEQAIGTPTKDELVMSPQENMETIKLDEAEELSDVATAIKNTCSILIALPEIETAAQPMGLGMTMQFDASKVAEGMMMVADLIDQEAGARNSEASRAGRKATMIRQLQERRLQANQAGYDIVNTDKQIESQRTKLSICDADVEIQNRQMKDSMEADEFLRTKYTNEALYAWMDASARQTLYQTYQITMEAARASEKSLSFEIGTSVAPGVRLATNYWDIARDGAFAAQHLFLDLKRIENLYQSRKPHDFEMTKSISLRQIDPWALVRLQETGTTDFAIPELLFDFDFPGHYCRRIRSVSATIPCITGPYTSVSCTMHLLEHGYRLRQDYKGSPYYPLASIDADPRYSTNKIAISSVALSSGQQDAGVFELNFSGSERYGPFEGAGAVSRWSVGLPTAVRQFDYRTISDVVLHMNYTSLDGGPIWQKAASDAVVAFRTSLDERLHTSLLDLRDAFLISSLTGFTKAVCRGVPDQLPFWTRGKSVEFKRCWLVATKNLGLIAPKMPTVNGNSMSNSAEVEAADDSLAKQAIVALGDSVDVVETGRLGTKGGLEWTDITVEVEGLRAVVLEKGTGVLRKGRIWLLAQYELGAAGNGT